MSDTNNTTSQALQALPPSQVPFTHPNYTYADRERELVLMDHLLTKQHQDNRMELAYVRQQILSGEYLTNVNNQYQQTELTESGPR